MTRLVKPNKTEEAYLSLLDSRQRKGEILRFEFQPRALKIAKDAKYTPDFLVVERIGDILRHTYYEVKGAKRTTPSKRFPLGNIVPYCRTAERVRIKVAASLYPQFRFIMVWPAGPHAWMEKEYGHGQALAAVGGGS